MKIKNRKGSTLALTIMIFAVLMIFATFTLGFMVTENKQAMYHQNKTQAYYIARSGAEVVEGAVLGLYEEAYESKNNIEVKQFFNALYNEIGESITLENVDVNSKIANVDMILENVQNDGKNYQLTIKSTSSVGGVEASVQKVINIVNPTVVTKVGTNAKIIYLNSINDQIEEINKLDPGYAVKGNPSDYKTPIFETFEELAGDNYRNDSLSGSLSGEYFVQSLNGLQLSGKSFTDKVTIYVKGSYIISQNLEINTSGLPQNLNIIVLGEGLSTQPSIDFSYTKGKITKQIANISVKSGEIRIDMHKYEHVGNLILGDNSDLEFFASDNSNPSHVTVTGIIFAPASTVSLGDSKHGSISIKGSIIGYDVNYDYKVKNIPSLKLSIDNSGGENNNPIELEQEVYTTLQKGFFK